MLDDCGFPTNLNDPFQKAQLLECQPETFFSDSHIVSVTELKVWSGGWNLQIAFLVSFMQPQNYDPSEGNLSPFLQGIIPLSIRLSSINKLSYQPEHTISFATPNQKENLPEKIPSN